MINQFHDWRTLADAIFDKVSEYIDEKESWDEGAKLWVDVEIGSVTLAKAGEVLHGDGTLVTQFIRKDDYGNCEPDGDIIEEYAYQWFDIRTGD